jgi:putative glutamine amidotransferase
LISNTMTTPHKRKIYVVGGSWNYAQWMDGEITGALKDADLVVFTGGTDINSKLYDRKPNSNNDLPDDLRDSVEKEAFSEALSLGKPMVGICRGSQFLCAMAGGILVQHQQHPSSHYVVTSDGRSVHVSSDHHQRQYPFVLPPDEFIVKSWANRLSPFSLGEDGDDMSGQVEVEDVYYPKIKALGIQSHPEWLYPSQSQEDYDSIVYHRGLLKRLITGTMEA